MSERSEEQRGSPNGSSAAAAASEPIGKTVRSKRAARATSARSAAKLEIVGSPGDGLATVVPSAALRCSPPARAWGI